MLGMEPLKSDDLTMLSVPEPPRSGIKQIRDHHHRLAVLVAQGKRTGEIAAETGMSLSRISILKSDPAFQQLVAAYRDKCQEIEFDAYATVVAKRQHLELLLLEAMEARVTDAEELIDIRSMLDMYADMADRNGHSKVLKSQRLNVNMDLADGLAEARQRELRLSAADGGVRELERADSKPAEEPAPVVPKGDP